jgi:hypothetical protein
MNGWLVISAAAVGSTVGAVVFAVLVYRRLRRSEEISRALELAQSILRDRTIPIDVEINQEVPISLAGTYRVPADLKLAVSMDDPIDIEARVPVRASIPLDVVVESSVLRLGTVKVPIRAEIPIDMEIPVKTRATIRSDRVTVRLTEELELALPQVVVPLKAKLRVNIPLELPKLPDQAG